MASYNVHRWTGVRGGRAYAPEKVQRVLGELNADVLALQEVLRPFERPDPLAAIAHDLGFHLAFVVTRHHKRGELGNAVLSRWPLSGAVVIDLTFGRLERRAALAVQISSATRRLQVAATHLALVDRTRKRQVSALLDHPQLGGGPVVLMGDMNAWRRTQASRQLDDHFERHHNQNWPPSYPSVRPVLALDRLYAKGARVVQLATHASDSARRASDHLPIVATLELNP
ncbi:MAG: endonuclease/exonuclease/phosphatase family protein [Bacteroidota bacterium]